MRQHPRGWLERGRRDERLGRQRGLGDAEQLALELRAAFALGNKALVLGQHLEDLDLLALQELAVARLGDLDLAQHLTNDRFDEIGRASCRESVCPYV